MDDVEAMNAIAALTANTIALDRAKLLLPRTGGLYAWWVVGHALADVPLTQHPAEPDVALLYVGIAPNGPRSKATLRSRVVGNHMRGNIAASTFRRTLASLLVDSLCLAPTTKGTKVVLPPDHNARLSSWQNDHLRLTWFETAAPWDLEKQVIAALRPPLNLAANDTHPFYATLSTARRALRDAAR